MQKYLMFFDIFVNLYKYFNGAKLSYLFVINSNILVMALALLYFKIYGHRNCSAIQKMSWNIFVHLFIYHLLKTIFDPIRQPQTTIGARFTFSVSHLTQVDPSFNAAPVNLFSCIPECSKQKPALQPHNAGMSKNNSFAEPRFSNFQLRSTLSSASKIRLRAEKKVHEPARPVHSEGAITLCMRVWSNTARACSPLFHFSLFVFAADRISLTLSAITSWLTGQVKPMRAPRSLALWLLLLSRYDNARECSSLRTISLISRCMRLRRFLCFFADAHREMPVYHMARFKSHFAPGD